MATRNRFIFIGVGVLLLLIVVALASIPRLLNPDSFRARIESALSSALGRKVTLGKLDLSLWSGSLVAQNAVVTDDPAFSNQPFLRVSLVKIRVEVIPLIFGHEVHIEGFELVAPQITLLRADNGVWNYSSIGHAAVQTQGTQAQGGSMISNLTADHVVVSGGTLLVGSVPGAGAASTPNRVYTGLSLDVKNLSFAKSFPFSASAQLPGMGSLSIEGAAGPINPQDASLTPFTAHAEVKHLDLAAAGVLDASSGGGLLNLDARATSDGRMLNANGVAHVEGLRLAKGGASSSQPVDVRFAGTQNMQSNAGQLQHSTVTIGSAVINVAGTYQPSGAVTQASLKVDAPAIPIDQIQAFLPSLGIKLPSGSRLQGGTLTTSLNVTGPIGNPVISGPLRLDNTQLIGFDLGSDLSSIAPLSGLRPGSGTVIRSLSLNLYAANGSIRTDNVVLEVPALGSATGSGTIAASGALDYQVNLKLAALSGGGTGAAGAGGVAGQLMGMVPGGAGKMIGALPANVFKNGIPLAIGGTTSNPTFKPSFVGRGGNSSGTSKGRPPGNSLGNALGNLLKGPR